MNRKECIIDSVKDLVWSLLWDDRKEDECLQRGQIEEAIETKEISIEEVVNIFEQELRKRL